MLKSNKTLVLAVGAVLVVLGLLKPDFSSITNILNTNIPTGSVEITVSKPTDPAVLQNCSFIISEFKNGPSSRKTDALKLSSLYHDLANLISLDDEKQVIKNTLEIRTSNILAGTLFNLNIKDKYPKLDVYCNQLLIDIIGENDVLLDPELRKKSVEAFRALSWACYEGSK